MSPRSDTHPHDPLETHAERRLKLGRVAGLLFCVAASVALVAQVLVARGAPSLADAGPALIGLASGAACLAVAWNRLSGAWLHVLPVAATAQLGVAVTLAGVDGAVYSRFFFLVAVFVAYAFRSRRAIAAHVGLAALGLCVPLVLPHSGREVLLRALVSVPTLVVIAAVVAFLRERLEAGQVALRDLVLRDPLTGVGNYRALYERLEYELVRHTRHDRPLAVLVLDLDRFKEVNDTLGHQAGDRVLKGVGQALRRTVRAQDTVARQGGDEFAVLLPESGDEDAAVLAERVDEALGRIQVDGRALSTSVGWAIFPEDGTSLDELLTAADHRQIRDKREGRVLALAGGRAVAG